MVMLLVLLILGFYIIQSKVRKLTVRFNNLLNFKKRSKIAINLITVCKIKTNNNPKIKLNNNKMYPN